MTALPARNEVDPKYTWNTATIFATIEAWEAAFGEVEQGIANLSSFSGTLGQSPARLLEWLKLSEELTLKLLHVAQYARLNYAVDATNQQNAAYAGRVTGLAARFEAATAFEEPELMAVGFDTLRRWVKETPALQVYAHAFDLLERRAAHLRSAEVEELLGEVSDAFGTASQTHGILANADLTFKPAHAAGSREKVEVTHAKMRTLLSSPDRKLRETGWRSYADAHLAYQNTMSNCLAAGIKQDAFNASARRYGSALEMALESNNLPVSVFHNVIETFKANVHVWHRYWELRRRFFGLRKLRVYDTYATLGEKPLDIPYEQAVAWIAEGMAPLGEEYTATLRKGALEQRWVDSAMNKGKRFGAFSYGVRGSQPFIMMSYDNSIYGLSTLAHELGHSMHSVLTNKTQPAVYSRYGLFLAEVASNFNQAMVRAYLLRTQTERDFQLAVLQEAMSNFYRYFFTMPSLAMFDMEMHARVERGEALTAGLMNRTMAEVLRLGYGPRVEVDTNRDGCLWAQFSTHLYSTFYTYQYTTGISGAHALAGNILEGKAGAVQAYLNFLSAGNSLFPLDALKMAGVDLTSPAPVEQTFRVLESHVAKLEELVG